MKSSKQIAKQEQIIRNYIRSYNDFDINGMIRDFDVDIVFENITNGKVDLEITGIEAFKKQAEKTKLYFTNRNQKIEYWCFDDIKVAISIYYKAKLGVDLSDRMKSGDIMELRGRTEFVIVSDKIKSIKDFSENNL